MATTAEKVRELRDKTGAGVMDCKEALNASDNFPRNDRTRRDSLPPETMAFPP